MQKRHTDIIENTLDLLKTDEVVRFSKRQLRIMFDADRLSKNAYRDIFDRLPEGVPISDLSILENGDDLFILKHRRLHKAATYI